VVAPLNQDNALAIVDTDSLTLRAKVPICVAPTDAVILPDSTKAFVACSGSGEVAAVQLKNTAHQQAADGLLTILRVAKTPTQLALKPDGGEVFAMNFDGGTISEIATQANEVGGSYNIGSGPVRGVLASDNATLYVSNFLSDSVAVFDITISKFLGRIQVGNKPDALALSSGGQYLYVANSGSGDLAVINLSKKGRKFVTMIPLGKQPTSIAVKTFIAK
ncbi:MAG TPA: YncE family protein, partial [Tepidisphaeraceae bacterium]|nr:YncE family protein [Tepidisphaeraceae bacterium]